MMVNDSIGQFNRSIAFLVRCVTLRSKKSWARAQAAAARLGALLARHYLSDVTR